MYICMYVCMYMHMYVYICMYVCIDTYTNRSVKVYIYIYIYSIGGSRNNDASRYSIYVLYLYKSANTDAEASRAVDAATRCNKLQQNSPGSLAASLTQCPCFTGSTNTVTEAALQEGLPTLQHIRPTQFVLLVQKYK